MEEDLFANKIYPFQDDVLQIINQVETGFYLTGGTAASRGYLNHRYSDDLDFFVNDDSNYGLWVDRLILALNKKGDWEIIRWIKRPPEDEFIRELHHLGEKLILLS